MNECANCCSPGDRASGAAARGRQVPRYKRDFTIFGFSLLPAGGRNAHGGVAISPLHDIFEYHSVLRNLPPAARTGPGG